MLLLVIRFLELFVLLVRLVEEHIELKNACGWGDGEGVAVKIEVKLGILQDAVFI
jgi:hypothetical protein